MKSKLIPVRDAVADFIEDGHSVVLGACLEPDIPFAITHELIRQHRRDLNIIAPISDASTDMLIGAGCVGRITGAWVGNVSGGLGHNYRRAFETGVPHKVEVKDHSNFSLGMALMAGAYGMPYATNKSLLGSDILKSNPDFRVDIDPFSSERQPIVLIPPLNPDVAVICVQRSDPYGNCHHWGNFGVGKEAAMAAKTIILLADEIVDSSVILSDPSRIPFPGWRVDAVCCEPGGVHPSPMTGRWKRDNAFFNDYHAKSRERHGFIEWLDEWVLGVPDHKAYREKLGERFEALRIKGDALSAPANYAAE